MSNNTILPVPSGSTNGDTVRSLDRAGIKTQVVLLDLGGAGAESLVTGTMPVSGSITVANASLAVTGTFWQATQPVSGTVTVGNASLAVTGAFFQATQPVSAVSLPLPAGAATETTLAALNTKIGAAGQALMAASTPVVLASNQSAVPVSGTVTANAGTGTMAVSAASLPLPAGAATETTLAALNTKVTAVNTGAVVISGALPAGAAVIGAVTQSGTWNIGTVTTLPALVAGTAIVGKVGIDQTTPGTTNLVSIGTNGTVALNAAIPTGANVIGALTANQSVNNSQLGGVAVAVGTGISSTGTQRVTLATDIALPPAAAAPATYSAAVVGLASALTATDIFTITGSATKTIRVSRIVVNGVQTTAAQVNVLIIKRSTANTAGTSAAATAVSYDSANAAATATVLSYTANPTTGTAVGTASARRAFIPGAASATDAQGLEMISGDVGQQMLTLRGIAQVIAVNLNATTIAGSAFNITVEWTES